ncbi:MAG TPA: tyrosine-type recombinase/integrase [Rudaea sp.]|nr:tyrosine-type recombinase/integrase [Rudaea sp.]
MNDLTEAQLKAAKAVSKPYKLADGGGLHILIKANGKKLFQYRYRHLGKETTFAIGEYPVVTLRDAREKRNEARRLVAAGVNPSHARAQAKNEAARAAANTFEAIGRGWIAHNERSWSPYYLKQVTTTLESDVFPIVGRKPIKGVSARMIREILSAACELGAPTVAILIRQWCSAIFRFAVADDFAAFDPVTALKGFIKRPRSKHSTALTKEGISGLLKKLRNAPGTVEVNTAIRILLLTFVRPGELRNAQWSEFDLPQAEWRIPGHRMKMLQSHIVPLSRQAVTLFEQLPRSSSQALVFPNTRDSKRCMSPTTLNRFLERLKLNDQFSAHGFRATASTMLNELGYPTDAIERQLAHNERNSVKAAYNHAKHLPERKKMMQDWADLVLSFE